MPRAGLLRQRLLTLFLAGILLLFSPLAVQFEPLDRWFGIPLILIYLFVVWALIIAVAAWIFALHRD